MNLFYLKLTSALIIFIVALLGGALPFLKRLKSNAGRDFPIGEALASGVFLGAGLLHMLADSSNDFNGLGYGYPLPFLLCGVTFLALLWIEHLGREFYEHGHTNSFSFAIMATIMLSLHSFLAGAALGLSNDFSVMIVILVAILAHKWAASFALAIQINKSTLTLQAGLFLFMIFAIMAPVGVLFGNLVTNKLTAYPLIEPVFTSLAAGTFLYLGTLHGLARSVMVNKCCNLNQYTFVILGFALMAIVAIWT